MADTPPQQQQKPPQQPPPPGDILLPDSQQDDDESIPFAENAQRAPFSQASSDDANDDATRVRPLGLPNVGNPVLLSRRRRAPPLFPPRGSETSESSNSQNAPTQRINPTQVPGMPPPIPSASRAATTTAPPPQPQRVGQFEQNWRDMHEWMRTRLEMPESWLNWMMVYFPVIAYQIMPAHAIWLVDVDLLHHAHEKLMQMLRAHKFIAPTAILFPPDYSFDDMMGPPSFCSDTRSACLEWTRMMGPLRRLQEATYLEAIHVEAGLARSIALGEPEEMMEESSEQPEDDEEHEEEEEEEEEPEIIPPARRPRGKQQPLPKRQVRTVAPEEEDDDDDDE